MHQLTRAALWVFAIYYAMTGLWPLVSMDSFMAITGPKTDQWLVRMVALLTVSIGVTVASAGWRGARSPEIAVLVVASALSFSAIDVIYVALHRIWPIYLADVPVEAALALTIVLTWRIRPSRESA